METRNILNTIIYWLVLILGRYIKQSYQLRNGLIIIALIYVIIRYISSKVGLQLNIPMGDKKRGATVEKIPEGDQTQLIDVIFNIIKNIAIFIIPIICLSYAGSVGMISHRIIKVFLTLVLFLFLEVIASQRT
jgi:hypothetical protein